MGSSSPSFLAACSKLLVMEMVLLPPRARWRGASEGAGAGGVCGAAGVAGVEGVIGVDGVTGVEGVVGVDGVTGVEGIVGVGGAGGVVVPSLRLAMTEGLGFGNDIIFKRLTSKCNRLLPALR